MSPSRSKLPNVGAVIREFRLREKLSQDSVAARLKMSTSYVSRLESGSRYPSIEMLIRVAHAMNARPGDLLDRIAEDYDFDDSPEL